MLRGHGLSAPEIFAEDRELGMLLIEDFGDDTYTRLLAGGADETALYALAIDTLIALQRAVTAGRPTLPPYDEATLLGEAALLVDWYAPSVLGAPLPPAARDEYLALWREVLPLAALPADAGAARLPRRQSDAAAGRAGGAGLRPPRLPGRAVRPGELRPGVAARRCAARRAASAARGDDRALSRRFPGIDRGAFRRSAAILAAQRNAKIIGIFTRLWRRDGKPQYLDHIPRVWRLLEADLREPALRRLAGWLDRHLPPAARRVPERRSAA
jgi:aminoglycoside/choline kinase family phosphotransferase